MKTLFKNIKIPSLKGTKTIAQAKGFTYIDSDFKDYGTDVKGKKTKETELTVQEMDTNASFKDIFTKPEEMCLTQEQILYFIEHEKDKLRQNEWATFFLFKEGSEFFVANVVVGSDGLKVYVFRFSDGYVWDADFRYRVVLPQSSIEQETPKRIYNSTFECWRKMKSRCNNPNQSNYHNYGGRGITYSEEWENYDSFLNDMGEKPEGLSIDRIDTNGDYCKENCRWATPKEQASNRRDSLVFKGENAKDASIRLGGGYNLVQQRVHDLEWDIERAFTTPIKPQQALESSEPLDSLSPRNFVPSLESSLKIVVDSGEYVVYKKIN